MLCSFPIQQVNAPPAEQKVRGGTLLVKPGSVQHPVTGAVNLHQGARVLGRGRAPAQQNNRLAVRDLRRRQVAPLQRAGQSLGHPAVAAHHQHEQGHESVQRRRRACLSSTSARTRSRQASPTGYTNKGRNLEKNTNMGIFYMNIFFVVGRHSPVSAGLSPDMLHLPYGAIAHGSVMDTPARPPASVKSCLVSEGPAWFWRDGRMSRSAGWQCSPLSVPCFACHPEQSEGSCAGQRRGTPSARSFDWSPSNSGMLILPGLRGCEIISLRAKNIKYPIYSDRQITFSSLHPRFNNDLRFLFSFPCTF